MNEGSGYRKMSKAEFLDRFAIDMEERKRRKAHADRMAELEFISYRKEIKERILGRINHMKRR